MARHVYDPYKWTYCPTDVPNKLKYEPRWDYGSWRRTNARIKDFDGKPIIGWKKAFLKAPESGYCLVQLKIPSNATRYQPENKKCRASRAVVVSIHNYLTGDILLDVVAKSDYDPTFLYEVGKVVKPTSRFSKDFKEDCASGIHFFLTQDEARNYCF